MPGAWLVNVMADPLVVNPLCPFRTEQTGQGQFQQQIPDRGRV